MSDLDVFRAMLDRAGIISYTEQIDPAPAPPEPITMVTINSTGGPFNKGYQGFFCEWAFGAAGNLQHVGIWE